MCMGNVTKETLGKRNITCKGISLPFAHLMLPMAIGIDCKIHCLRDVLHYLLNKLDAI